MSRQETIPFQADGVRLTGTLHLPNRSHPDVVIGCHGLLADRRSPKQIALADTLNRMGMAYFRFDHRGCGESQGRFEPEALLASRCRDLYHAIALMQTHPGVGAVVGLFGSSFGGTVVLSTAADCRVPALATYAAPVHSHAVTKAAGKQIRAHNALSGHDLTTFAFDIRSRLGALQNILIMHGQSDQIVPPEHARLIYTAARAPKKIIFFDNCDHRMSSADHQRRFLDACASWFHPFSIQ